MSNTTKTIDVEAGDRFYAFENMSQVRGNKFRRIFWNYLSEWFEITGPLSTSNIKLDRDIAIEVMKAYGYTITHPAPVVDAVPWPEWCATSSIDKTIQIMGTKEQCEEWTADYDKMEVKPMPTPPLHPTEVAAWEALRELYSDELEVSEAIRALLQAKRGAK